MSLDDWGWGKLLELQPQYVGHCEWDKLSETVRRFLLRVQPRIMEYVDESKIDWSGLGDVVTKRYYARLKKEGLPPEDEREGETS